MMDSEVLKELQRLRYDIKSINKSINSLINGIVVGVFIYIMVKYLLNLL